MYVLTSSSYVTKNVKYELFTEPYLDIIIQPKQHGQRFRYKCESKSAGSLIGEGSNNEQKVYPTAEVDVPFVANLYLIHTAVSCTCC